MSKIMSGQKPNEKSALRIFRRLAPNIAGIAIKNENSAAVARLNPNKVAPKIVLPERLVPGTKAKIWNIPTLKAFLGVI